MSITMAAAHPERVERVVIYGGFARIGYAPDYPDGIQSDVFDAFAGLIAESWGTGRIFSSFLIDGPDDTVEEMARLERNACTPQMAVAIMRANFDIDVRPLLATVAAPTLVLHNRGDPLVSVTFGRVTAEHVPNCELRQFDGDFHCTSYIDRAVPPIDNAVQFLVGGDGVPATVATFRRLASVLFTDIAGSTAMAVGVGDRAWSGVLTHHDAVSAAAVERCGGRLVKQTGDGVVAVFDGPSRAIQCARDIRRAVKSLGLDMRAGVHTGEIELRGDDVGGIGVHTSARVMSAAEPGRTWVTRTVRDLTTGSSVEFEDRGGHSLKGVPEEWQLYAVVD